MFEVGLRVETYFPQDLVIACTTSLRHQIAKCPRRRSIPGEARCRRPVCSTMRSKTALSLFSAREDMKAMLSASALREQRDTRRAIEEAISRHHHAHKLLPSAPLSGELKSARVVVASGRFFGAGRACAPCFKRPSNGAGISVNSRAKILIINVKNVCLRVIYMLRPGEPKDKISSSDKSKHTRSGKHILSK
jgi:hypothetical protein